MTVTKAHFIVRMHETFVSTQGAYEANDDMAGEESVTSPTANPGKKVNRSMDCVSSAHPSFLSPPISHVYVICPLYTYPLTSYPHRLSVRRSVSYKTWAKASRK